MLKPQNPVFLWLFFNSVLSTPGFAYDTLFDTGTGRVNGQKVNILSIPTAEALEISIHGEIDAKHDVLRVYTMKGEKTMQKIFEEKGKVDAFFVVEDSNSIKVTFNADNSNSRPGATVSIATLSPLTLMNGIKQNINKALNKIEHQGAAIAAIEIDKSLNRFQALQNQLQESNRSSELLKSVNAALTQLHYSYTRIAELREKLKETNSKSLNNLKQIQTKTKKHLDDTQARLQKEQEQISAWQKQLLSITDGLHRKRLDISIKAHQSLLKSLDLQQQVWLASLRLQEALTPSLEHYFEHIDLLLYTLSLNADIYREAANVIQHDAQFAAETLTGLSSLKEILQTLNEDWVGIDAVQSKINEIGF